MKSFNFDTLTGTNGTGGVHSFVLRDLAIDGNRASNVSGYGIRVYGYGHQYDNIVVSECSNEGIYSEWSTNTSPPSPHSMETVYNNVKVHGCDTVCIRYRGSHDSHWYNVVAYAGTLGNCVVEASANYDGGVEMHACHFWGSGAGVPSLLVTSASVGGFPIISEGSHGAGGIGVKVETGGTLKGKFIVFANETGMILNSQANDIELLSYGNDLTGLEVNSSFNYVRGKIESHDVTNGKGLWFSNGGGVLQGCTFDFRMKDNRTHIEWVSAHTNCFVRAHIITDTGETAVSGTANAVTNTIAIYSVGIGTNYLLNRPVTSNYVVQNVASTAEVLNTFQVADDATSYLKLENASASDAIFIPRWNGLSNLASSSTALALELRGQLRSSSDTGTTTPVIIANSMLHTSAGAVAVRDLFGVRNNSVNHFVVGPTGAITLGANQRLKLAETNLTALRTFTYPDVSDVVLGLAATQSPTNKTFDSTNTISSATSLPTVTIAKGGTGQTTAAAGFDALSAMTALGDTQYGGASGTRTRLAGNTTTTTQYLSQTGDGTNSVAPAWRTPRSLVLYNWNINTSTNSNFFLLLFTGTGTVTESLMDIITDYDLLVKRLRVAVSTNTKAGSCTASFRDDGADVTGATVTITTGTAGEYDSGAISVSVAAGSKICGRVDASAGVSGTLTLTAIVECEVLLT